MSQNTQTVSTTVPQTKLPPPPRNVLTVEQVRKIRFRERCDMNNQEFVKRFNEQEGTKITISTLKKIDRTPLWHQLDMNG